MTKKIKKKKNEFESAFFYQRLVAFIIDMVLVLMVASVVSLPFTDSNSITKLTDESNQVIESYMNKDISAKKYISRSIDISYDLARESGISTTINLVFLVLYFVVFQFYNKGQTIGKKFLRIKTVGVEDDLSINALIVRSLIIDFILVDMIIFAFVIFGNKNNYFYASGLFEGIQYVVVFVSAMMILFKDKGQGIHDKLAHTKVIRLEVKEKENELCES